MRLPLIAPPDLSREQKPLYDAMRKGIASNFNAFILEILACLDAIPR